MAAEFYNPAPSDLPGATVEFLTENVLLILLALTSGGMLLWQSFGGANGAGAGRVSAAETVRLINREKAVLVDVCDVAEFAAGHATGARNVPMATLDAAKGLPTNKSLPIVVMCSTGTRASRAASALRKKGFERVLVLAGGMKAWREASLPVEKSS